jgi:uncharacterized membrane protein
VRSPAKQRVVGLDRLAERGLCGRDARDQGKREDARGTWVDSHFRWQIRTFWITLAGSIVFWILSLIVIGIPLLIALYIWAIYRIVKGWLRLYERRSVSPERMF